MKQTAGRDALSEFAPMFAHLNDDVLFGEVWDQEAISAKTKCIVTIVALMSQGITDSSLRYHLENARNNGVTRPEAAAIITHATMYAGWPKGWAAFNLAKEVWKDDEPVAQDDVRVADPSGLSREFPKGEPNTAYAQYFVGNSWLAPLGDPQLGAANVTFEPGCRNNWHIHHKGGQVLICIAGRGWYQEWGKPAQELKPGDVVSIQPEVKHWHGAAADSWFQHIALAVPAEGACAEWLEPVSDQEYDQLG
ncbi:Cupin domain protein [Olsenella sp. KH3B4]|uniref:carboxymuconolactone decarboxylase family protein n=1 Tax=Olsenella sp. KH3B4 TaxID=1855394 RepID=UPI0008D6D0E8|nr:carboxymuconolactone decarboxylase family protein [Olsenella sp. KH3B4]SET18450.1 Cupin domain protein [Olsenella sp. KH3B4]